MLDERTFVDIDYENHQGRRFWRRIKPVSVDHNYNQYHSTPSWLLTALDISGDGKLKTFAMKKIFGWREMPPGGAMPPMPVHPER